MQVDIQGRKYSIQREKIGAGETHLGFTLILQKNKTWVLGLPQRETSFKEKHLFQSRSSFANETHLNYFRTVRRRPWWCWGPSERGPMSASPALGSCQVMPVMLDLKGHNKSKEVAVLLGTCNKQCDYGMRLLLPRSGNLCLLPVCLPIQHTPRPSPPHPHLSAELILQPGPHCLSSQAVGPGCGSGGMLHPHQTLSTGPSKWESETWSPSRRQVLAVSGMCTPLPGGAIVTDTAKVVMAMKA